MNNWTVPTITTIVISLGLALSPASTALAKQASQLSDLVGARAAGGETELESRDYTFIAASTAYGGAKAGYWWNGSAKSCVRVETFDGKFRAITDATAEQCNQHATNGNQERNTAAALVGVAAIAAALASKNNAHGNPSDKSGQHDLGYNDGLHDAPYYNPSRSDAYSSGYEQGVAQRSRNISYHGGTGGYTPAARVNEVVCTSNNGKYTECALAGGGDIVMKQQLSKAACVKDQTWGETANGVYVKDGCRAIFETMP